MKQKFVANKEKLNALEERKANGNYNIGSSKDMTEAELGMQIRSRKQMIADVQRKIAAVK